MISFNYNTRAIGKTKIFSIGYRYMVRWNFSLACYIEHEKCHDDIGSFS